MKINPTEVKTKAASWAAFLISLAGLSLLGTVSTDYVHALPDLLEVPAYSLLATVGVWLAGFNARHKPANMSPSAVEALRVRMGERFAGLRKTPSV